MREASYEDAVIIAQQLNLRKDDIWRIIRGARCSGISELSMLVHERFKQGSPDDAPQEGDGS